MSVSSLPDHVGWPRFSEPGSRSDTRRQENVTDGCDLLRLRRAGLKTGVTPATSRLRRYGRGARLPLKASMWPNVNRPRAGCAGRGWRATAGTRGSPVPQARTNVASLVPVTPATATRARRADALAGASCWYGSTDMLASMGEHATRQCNLPGSRTAHRAVARDSGVYGDQTQIALRGGLRPRNSLMLITSRISKTRSRGSPQSWIQQAKSRFSQPSATRSRMSSSSRSPWTTRS